jgi:hypothetical protein
MMHLHFVSSADSWLVTLSAFAGAVHVLAPDHWMPLSLASWQRKWGAGKTFLLSLLALGAHLLMGFALYLAIRPVLMTWNSKWLFPASVLMVILCAAARTARFSRIREVLRMGPNRLWSAFAVLSLLGPCESLIPVMVKAHHLGFGYLSAGAAFAVGTVVSGIVTIALGRLIWNHPRRFTRGIDWTSHWRSVVPAALGVALGIIFILKL